jgi:8-oxo-dGTP diphosphatase
MAMSPYIRALRTHLGHTRLLMPSVASIVRDSSDRILLVQARDDGRWSTPGGSIEMDETPAEAVVRETREETGLVVAPTRVVAVYGGPAFVVRYPNGDETQYVSVMFGCDVLSGELRADGDEVEAAKYWARDDALRLPLSPWLVDVLPRLFDADDTTWFERPSR